MQPKGSVPHSQVFATCPYPEPARSPEDPSYTIVIHGDQKVSVNLMITIQKTSVYSNNPQTINDLQMGITEYIRNVDRAILNTVFENTVQRVNKFLVTGGGHFEHYL
jgi:hypothetical protein